VEPLIAFIKIKNAGEHPDNSVVTGKEKFKNY
jgi:hypothetical protein